MADVLIPWGRSCTDTIIAPRNKQLHLEQRHLIDENQYTARITEEATAYQRWNYQISWDDLSAAEGKALDLILNRIKGTGSAAEVPVWVAYTQPNISFHISGQAGAQQCTLSTAAGLEPGMYFRAGDYLHYITDIEGLTATVKPLLRTTHTLTAASTYRPTGRFFLADRNAAVRWAGARATADLAFWELF
jgi:hypothetical protein